MQLQKMYVLQHVALTLHFEIQYNILKLKH